MVDSSEDQIKGAFLRVKEHMETLEREVRANREFIIQQNEQIKTQNEQIISLMDQINALEKLKQHNSKQEDQKKSKFLVSNGQIKPKKEPISPISSLSNEDSIGNKGASLDGYSLPGYSLPSYSLDIQRLQEQLPMILSKISRQEFLTFLTVYQQEESIGKVTYETIAKEINISTGCVRTYISGLIKKGLPIVKAKYNNKIIILSIPREIRGLNLKKKLIQIFYNQDPNQRKLGEDF